MRQNVLIRNNVNQSGTGKQTMLFAHGYGCDQNMWRFITSDFEKNYRLVLFDYTGSGKSDISDYDYKKYSSLNGYVQDVIDICEELNAGKVIFVGHSVSSIIGALAAARRQDLFSCLIMIGPSPCYINDESYSGGFSKQDIDEHIEMLDSNYLGWSSAITPVIAGQPESPEFATELHNSFCRMNPGIAKQFARVTFLGDNRQDLERVAVPTLVIQCNPDVIAPLSVGRYVHEHIKGSSYTQLDVSGHCPHLTAPEETVRAIRTYLEELYGE